MINATANDSGRSSEFSIPLDRREFLKTMGVLGGGLIVYFTVGNRFASAQMPPMNYPTDWNAYLRIAADGKVTCFTGKIDMGQGTVTSLPQIAAEELKVAYESVNIIMGDTDLCPYDFGTVGSMNIRLFGPALRKAAREARGVLKELAAEKLDCPVDYLVTKDGFVYDPSQPDTKIPYGDLTKGNIIERHLKEIPPETPPAEFTIMGKPYLHQDARDKVTGRAKYTGDIRLPGMLYAAVLRPPAHGAELKRLDVSGAKKMEGAMTMGMGYALTEELKFKNGKIFDRNFDTYSIPRFSWLPKIETVLVDNMAKPPEGGGEPGIIGVGAVIATGIHDATGAGLFQMPMTSARVKEALSRV